MKIYDSDGFDDDGFDVDGYDFLGYDAEGTHKGRKHVKVQLEREQIIECLQKEYELAVATSMERDDTEGWFHYAVGLRAAQNMIMKRSGE